MILIDLVSRSVGPDQPVEPLMTRDPVCLECSADIEGVGEEVASRPEDAWPARHG